MVAASVRTFDGIDRPDCEVIETMHPDRARYVGQELIKLANSIDNKPARDRTHARIKKNTAAIIAEARANDEVP